MILVDVRSQQEFEEDHVEGAINFDINRLIRGELPNISKNETLDIYCRTGNRSAVAEMLLGKAGYNVHNLGNLKDAKNYMANRQRERGAF